MKPAGPPTAGFGRTGIAIAIAFVLCGTAGAESHVIPQAESGQAETNHPDNKPADNSIHNAQDDERDALTPLDQSSTEADVEITRSIRKALVDDDTLGTDAQNVKVITVDGTVTLRGPVATGAEQARILDIARGAAGSDRVDSELEVIAR